MATLKVRVSAGARRDAIEGWRGDVLRVRVTAAAERGKANDAVCRFIADALGVRVSAVSVVRGAAARDKVLLVEGLPEEEARRRLSAAIL